MSEKERTPMTSSARLRMRFFASPVQIAIRSLAALVLFCVVVMSPRFLHGQSSKGILAGVVRDSTGAVLPNASVLITNEDTGESRTVISTGEGAYRAEAINPGS